VVRLPPDSLLVVPRLLEETGSSRELVLVMEDLCAAGFSAQPLISSLSLEDCFAVVRALAASDREWPAPPGLQVVVPP
jgi:hypothetical protein